MWAKIRSKRESKGMVLYVCLAQQVHNAHQLAKWYWLWRTNSCSRQQQRYCLSILIFQMSRWVCRQHANKCKTEKTKENIKENTFQELLNPNVTITASKHKNRYTQEALMVTPFPPRPPFPPFPEKIPKKLRLESKTTFATKAAQRFKQSLQCG